MGKLKPHAYLQYEYELNVGAAFPPYIQEIGVCVAKRNEREDRGTRDETIVCHISYNESPLCDIARSQTMRKVMISWKK